jgi:hypothetical protein
MPVLLDLQQSETGANTNEREDAAAELIAALSAREADLLWAALIQLKPHLRD